MDTSWSGRSALITGASRGFGLALTAALRRSGADVTAVVRPSDRLTALYELGARVLEVDLRDPKLVDVVSDAVEDAPVHLLVNNAGSGGAATDPSALDAERLRHLFELHVVAPAILTSALWANLRSAQGAQIVNVSSRMGSLSLNQENAFAGLGATYEYRVSKAALNMLSVCTAIDAQDARIEVFVIHPGRLATAMAVGDAAFQPAEAARRLLSLLRDARPFGGLIDLEEGGVLPW